MKKRTWTEEEIQMIWAKRYITVEELTVILGYSKQWVYAEVYKARVLGEGIPYKKFQRAIRFDLKSVLTWLDGRSETFQPMSKALKQNATKSNK